MFERFRRTPRSWPIAECVHEEHPAEPHWHWGWGQRRWSWDRPDRTHPYANTDEMHAKEEGR